MIRENLVYKLIALAVAIVLWMYVNSERPVLRKNISVPVEVQNLARGFVAEPSPSEVTVSIEGPKSLVESVQKEDVSAWVDLAGFNTDKQFADKDFRVQYKVDGLPESSASRSVNPNHVKVTIESVGGKRMPVEVKFLSAPPIGKGYGNPTLTPASVTVSGKSADVGQVKRVVLTVSSDVLAGNIDSEFPLTPMDAAGNIVSGVSLDPPKVLMSLKLIDVPAKKTVIVSASLQGNPKYPNRVAGVSVSPSVVTLEGMPKVLEKIGTVMTGPVSVDGAEADVAKDVGLIVPSGCRVEGSNQVRVSVAIGEGQ